jgi:hypothetical protein
MPAFVAACVSILATMFGAADDPECYALGGLDVARAQALADVNVAALERVYASDRAAGRDRRVLQRYAARGFRVMGSGMIRSSCRVVVRAPRRVELDVTERMAPSWVVDSVGRTRKLPRDGSSRHLVVLTGGTGRWRVASVR